MHWPLWRVVVAERSMEPTLRPGDRLLIWRGMGPHGGPGTDRRKGPWHGRGLRVRPGQLVVARHPLRLEMLLVKRAAWREAGGWWLDSDNPQAGAADSARFGLVPPELIVGRVLGRYFPVRRRHPDR
jgi:nickel-type superoxide dismutase maturation protease